MVDDASTKSSISSRLLFPTSWETVVIGIGLVSIYTLVSILGSRIITIEPPYPDPAAGLLLPFAILFGGVGVIAGVLGVITRDIVMGGAGSWTIAVALAHLFAGYVCIRLSRVQFIGVRVSGASFGRILMIALVTAIAAGATIGWAMEVLALAPFFLAGIITGWYILALLFVGIPVLLFGYQIVPARSANGAHLRSSLLIVGLLVCWLALGIVGSIGYYNLVRIPPWLLTDVGLGAIVPIIEHPVIGRGAVNLQSLLAAMAIGGTVMLFDRMQHEGMTWN